MHRYLLLPLCAGILAAADVTALDPQKTIDLHQTLPQSYSEPAVSAQAITATRDGIAILVSKHGLAPAILVLDHNGEVQSFSPILERVEAGRLAASMDRFFLRSPVKTAAGVVEEVVVVDAKGTVERRFSLSGLFDDRVFATTGIVAANAPGEVRVHDRDGKLLRTAGVLRSPVRERIAMCLLPQERVFAIGTVTADAYVIDLPGSQVTSLPITSDAIASRKRNQHSVQFNGNPELTPIVLSPACDPDGRILLGLNGYRPSDGMEILELTATGETRGLLRLQLPQIGRLKAGSNADGHMTPGPITVSGGYLYALDVRGVLARYHHNGAPGR